MALLSRLLHESGLAPIQRGAACSIQPRGFPSAAWRRQTEEEQASPSADTAQGRAFQSSQPGTGRQIEGRSILAWICRQTRVRHLEGAASHQDICSANLTATVGKKAVGLM